MDLPSFAVQVEPLPPTPRGIWQCLEIIFIVTIGEEDAVII